MPSSGVSASSGSPGPEVSCVTPTAGAPESGVTARLTSTNVGSGTEPAVPPRTTKELESDQDTSRTSTRVRSIRRKASTW